MLCSLVCKRTRARSPSVNAAIVCNTIKLKLGRFPLTNNQRSLRSVQLSYGSSFSPFDLEVEREALEP